MPEASPPVTEKSSPTRRMRIVRWIVLYAVLPYVAIVVLFTLAQRSLIYHPTRALSLSANGAGLSPEAARDVSLTTKDGLTLHGWILSARQRPDQAPDTPAPLLIYFPGNARHRGVRIHDLKEFARQGFNVLIFDYRGYGDNGGSPSETLMKADARLVWQFALDELNTSPHNIVLYGESLGGAVATNLAAEMCEQSTPPAALITNATFASLADTAGWHYPYFPIRLLLWDTWPSDERMPLVNCPVLMFHGVQDTIVPFSQGRKLFATALETSTTGIPKRFVELPHSGHNDIPVSTLRDELATLIDTLFGETNQSHDR